MNVLQCRNRNIDAICPVPLKQQPVRQYWDLRERRFFRWAILEKSQCVTKLLAVWISTLLLALFVFTLRSQYRELSYLDVLISTVIAELVVLLFLIRLYSAWYYIHSRLINREIDYKIFTTEKSRCWRKSNLILERDCLVARFQVRPILTRLKRFMLLLAIIISLNFLILFITTNY